MQRISTARRVSQVFLWVVPLVPIPWLVLRPVGPKVYAACIIQILLMAVAVWILAADAIKSSTADRRAVLLPGVFLIACMASATLAMNSDVPPTDDAVWVATKSIQHVRYVGLLVAGLLAWAGFSLLTYRLREAGERVFSVLGLAAATIATAMFTLFTLAALTVFDRAAQEAVSGGVQAWVRPLGALIYAWLVLFAVLTYLATSLYAMALRNVGLLGRVGRFLFVVLGVMAAALAIIAASVPNQSPTLTHGVFVFTIPAVPLILPYLMGVNLVRRAGDPVP